MRKHIVAVLMLIGLLVQPTAAQITIPNTFTPFTTISSNSVNQNFTEIGNKALNRTGGTMTGNLTLDPNVTVDGLDLSDFLTATQILTQVVGSAATPSYSVVGDTNTGMYFSAADQIAWSIAATKRLELTATTLTMTGDITSSGTVTGVTFSGSGASLTSLPAANLTGTIASAVQDNITRTGTIVSGIWNAGAVTSSSTLTATTTISAGGDFIFTGSNAVRRNTSDGSDTGFIEVAGGGAQSQARGGFIRVLGNENGSFPGYVQVIPGNIANSKFYVYNASGTTMWEQDATTADVLLTGGSLEIRENGVNGFLTITSTTASGQSTSVDFKRNGGSVNAQVLSVSTTGNDIAALDFYTRNAAGTLGRRMRINAEGGVSIGDTTDDGANNLRVAGTLRLVGGNIILGANFLSGDGGNEGVSVSAAGVTTVSGQLTMGGNIALGANRLSGDGDNEGITISSTGVVTTSTTLSMGGNILLNATWLSGDGGNEGIQVSSAGVVSTSGQLTVGGIGVISGASLAVGTTPATAGVLRIPNSQSLYARNAANTQDDQLIGLDASDVIRIGLDVNSTIFGSNVTIGGTLGAGTTGTEFVVNTSGLITTQSVGTAALRTATGSFSDTNGGENSMNDYAFFPNFEIDDCTAATFIQLGFTTTNQTNDTTARVGHTPTPGACGTGSYDGRWRYMTASDNPDIWIETNNISGQVTAVWEAEDPVENPMSQPGHTSTRLDVPTAADVKQMYLDLNPDIRDQARTEFLNYLHSRGWATAGVLADAVDEVPTRYKRAARMWAIRSIAKVIEVSPSELIMDTMEKTIDGKVKPKANFGTVVRDHRLARAARIAERVN